MPKAREKSLRKAPSIQAFPNTKHRLGTYVANANQNQTLYYPAKEYLNLQVHNQQILSPGCTISQRRVSAEHSRSSRHIKPPENHQPKLSKSLERQRTTNLLPLTLPTSPFLTSTNLLPLLYLLLYATLQRPQISFELLKFFCSHRVYRSQFTQCVYSGGKKHRMW